MIIIGRGFNKALTAALLLAGVAGTAHAAAEPLDIRQTFSGVSSVDIGDIQLQNIYGDDSLGTSDSYSLSAGAFSFSDPFLKSSANPPIYTAFFGVSTDDSGTDHLVLAVASAYAAGLVSGGEDFATIFPNYSEASLIADLQLVNATEGQPGTKAINDARSELVNFGFDIKGRDGFAPALAGPLSLISFSSATLVGTGTASLVDVGGTVSPLPEPASWAMMIGGFGLVGGALRRRTTRVRFA